MTKKTSKKASINTITVAQLDANGIYQGVLTIPETELTDAHIRLPTACDLKPGGYQWNSELQAFMPTAEFIKSNRADWRKSRG